ncbi:lipoprotein [Actinomadura rubrobrunea]|uniref:Lipoprotein n=1 Tax=Actinomadura rubrobrunea TaxID=115335 RepID=A0A9W6UWA0_9ACTN|nr:lipoprotein [Actinomadura rubrobrunea]
MERSPDPGSEAPVVPPGVRAGYAVFDRVTGKTVREHRAREVFRSASVVKILIALDHLERGGEPDPRLRAMLRSSDDAAASALWRRGGRGEIVERMAGRMGLVDTRPPPADKPEFWGYTALSAADVVVMYRYLLEEARPGHRDVVVGELRRATRRGTDHYDQYFGIPRAVPRPWAVKQGWSGFEGGAASEEFGELGLGRPVLHTTGLVGPGERYVMAVLTLQAAGTSFPTAAARVTELTRRLRPL